MFESFSIVAVVRSFVAAGLLALVAIAFDCNGARYGNSLFGSGEYLNFGVSIDKGSHVAFYDSTGNEYIHPETEYRDLLIRNLLGYSVSANELAIGISTSNGRQYLVFNSTDQVATCTPLILDEATFLAREDTSGWINLEDPPWTAYYSRLIVFLASFSALILGGFGVMLLLMGCIDYGIEHW